MVNFEDAIKRIEKWYDPENDIATPRVSHVEMGLLDIIKDLIENNKEITGQVEVLEEKVHELEVIQSEGY